MAQSEKKIVIVGGVAGGASAAARARRLSENSEIIVVERGPHVSFANCGLPYRIGGEISSTSELLNYTPESLANRHKLDVRVYTEAIRIDPDNKVMELRDTRSGETIAESYDALILSTGAAPLKPPIPGIERKGHFTVRTVPDVEVIMHWIDVQSAKTAVVVGGGYIGLEMAEQLHRRGLTVTIVEAMPQVMGPLDEEMAAFLHEEIRKQGVGLDLRDGVAGFVDPVADEKAAASVVVLKSGKRLPADLVILGLGVRPEVKLAKETGLEIGERGGIRVDEHMRTSNADIFAVGDAVEVRDGVTGEWTLVALAGPANRQGRIAADNIFGRDSTYRGTFGTAILRLFDLTAGCTGANERTLKRLGIEHEAVFLHPNSHAGYYPGAKPIALKLLFSQESGRILGAQAVGEDGIDKRIDVIATAIMSGCTVDDLSELELAYAPPFGSAKDAVNMAGFIAQNVINGDMPVVAWNELNGAQVLDVRDDKERKSGHIPGSVHIPINELRERMSELDRDRPVVAYCHSGQRSYYATRILLQNGFDAKNLTGAWRTWNAAMKDAAQEN